MSERQMLVEGGLVYISGYEFRVQNLRIETFPGGELVSRFEGVCTADKRNDSIRRTGYDGGVYGGNALAYRWEGQS